MTRPGKYRVLTAKCAWQPIDSAPKDGTSVLLFVPPRGCLIGHFVNHQEFDHGKLTRNRAYWAISALFFFDPSPTHWMPVPDPPGGAS